LADPALVVEEVEDGAELGCRGWHKSRRSPPPIPTCGYLSEAEAPEMRILVHTKTFLLLAALLPLPALGIDGLVEINQAKALAGGVTASDAPGFPVTLDAQGSYVLTSNLVSRTTRTRFAP
jgi:hypothetical protein